MITDDDIIMFFCGQKGKNIQRKRLKDIPDDIEEYLKTRYSDSLSYIETVVRIIKNIDVHPVCKVCGKPVLFDKVKNKFFETCRSHSCVNELRSQKTKATILKRYGYEYSFNNKDILDKSVKLAHTKESIEKGIETSKKKYGENNYRNRVKARKTKLERYGDENYVNSTKAKNTKLERYGDENYVNSTKAKNTKLEKYGDENYNNRELATKTNMSRYGVDCLFNNAEFQNQIHSRLIERYGSTFNLEKAKVTWVKKYGCDNPSKNEDVKKKIKETLFVRYNSYSWSSTEIGRKRLSEIGYDKDVQRRKHETMKANSSFNSSKPEETAYELLKSKFTDVMRQHSSALYPFNCDFYIPSIDTYIEFQGSQYHNGHPFDENNESDKRELERLMQLSGQSERHRAGKLSQYDNIIYVWTDLDVRKRNLAKQNNLRLIEFWSIDEIKEWLENTF